MLSDGSLSMHGKYANLQIDQKDYLFVQLLWDKFNAIGIVGAPPRRSQRKDGRISYQFATFTLPFLTDLFMKCYRKAEGKNIKVLPANIADLLTPIALAYWVSGCRLRSDPTGWTTLRSDPTGWTTAGAGAVALSGPDGSQTTGRVTLCTDSFTVAEVDLLRSILLDKFHIPSTRYLIRADQYRIRIAKSSMPSLQSLVCPHMPPSMRFRVGL
jgi:hypothetical protein